MFSKGVDGAGWIEVKQEYSDVVFLDLGNFGSSELDGDFLLGPRELEDENTVLVQVGKDIGKLVNIGIGDPSDIGGSVDSQ